MTEPRPTPLTVEEVEDWRLGVTRVKGDDLEGYWEKSYWLVVPRLLAAIDAANPAPAGLREAVELHLVQCDEGADLTAALAANPAPAGRCEAILRCQRDADHGGEHAALGYPLDAARPSGEVDVELLRLVLSEMVSGSVHDNSRYDSGDYGALERPSEFAHRIAEKYAARLAGSDSEGEEEPPPLT